MFIELLANSMRSLELSELPGNLNYCGLDSKLMTVHEQKYNQVFIICAPHSLGLARDVSVPLQTVSHRYLYSSGSVSKLSVFPGPT